ncbi:Rubrerythrin [uncultured Desulfobacterium sp.]|uniref:Rubrerythrin n=1 Tax=uncultured Desulfobacterium sp. TaxID=201089 RepID=A0A445MX96_9BACT|nr:Rubrerythrin [uncultured Desulfobacterium sp.]
MARLKGSQTEKNIFIAFAGESQARNRYTFYSSQAKKDGYVQISAIFEETANQEKEHAKRLFKLLEGGKVEIEIAGSFPAGPIGGTLDNLKEAAAGENHEHSQMYPQFAKTARDEGYSDIADIFMAIAAAERQHERQYNILIANIESGKVFNRDNEVVWRCRNCGYPRRGTEALNECPACAHPKAYSELLGANY